MKFASSISTAESFTEALDEVCASLESQLDEAPDALVVFASPHWTNQAESLSEQLRARLRPAQLIGCTGESIVGGAREIEDAPALAVWAACWKDVRNELFHLRFEHTPDGGTFLGWPDEVSEDWPESSVMIVLGDPFSFPTDLLIQNLEETHPGTRLVGGMASGAAVPGENRVFVGDRVVAEGAAAMLLSGRLSVETVVSQGCRPIGEPYVVTRAERNVILELGGKPALEQLQALHQRSATGDQQRMQRGLHVGRVISEYQDQFEQGDFLVRNVLGVEPESQGIAVGDYMRPGQTVQFHVRDAETSDAELRQLLSRSRERFGSASAALLFTCNGRGTRLFSDPHHDAATIAETFGDLPLAGFFAQGELGPVGKRNFVHGFTASVALFRESGETEDGA